MVTANIKKYYFLKILSLAFLTGTSACLAGCGKSQDEVRQEVVKCSAFMSIMTVLDMKPELGHATLAALEKDGVSDSEFTPIPAAAKNYTKDIDAGKVTSLTQAGTADARSLLKSNDADGIAKYLKSCAAAYKEIKK